MNVNLLDLKPQNAALEPELHEAFLRVLRSGHFILGPEVDRFERLSPNSPAPSMRLA
jgi:dTDP-4-amino-4,6-dideoxygalactose transaminase